MVWYKDRTTISTHHWLVDTVRGSNSFICTDLTNSTQTGDSTFLSSFNSNGFSIGNSTILNPNNDTFVSWTFRKAPKFFTQMSVTHTSGTADTVDLSTLGQVGMVVMKQTNGASNWFTWHRSLTTGNLLYLNTTAAQTADTTLSVTGTTLTVASTTPTGTYIVYAWAHDPDTSGGIIQAGSFTTDGGGNASVNLGWEPQWLLIKRLDATSGGNWQMTDVNRGWSLTYGPSVQPNTSAIESNVFGTSVQPTATGINFISYPTTSANFIYLAIRRPNKPVTDPTKVYNAIARTGTDSVTNVIGVGFSPDLLINKSRIAVAGSMFDRLRGLAGFDPHNTPGEVISPSGYDLTGWGMDGVLAGTTANFNFNRPTTEADWFFRRAP